MQGVDEIDQMNLEELDEAWRILLRKYGLRKERDEANRSKREAEKLSGDVHSLQT